MGFSNRNRASEYGFHLLEIHELYNCIHNVDKSKVVTNCKWELTIESITLENAKKLAPLNLKKELDHKSNKAVTDTWLLPLNKEEIEEGEYPDPPYKPIPLEEVELCDVVTTGEYIKAYYEVTDNLGTHLLARCLYHESLKHREGEEDFWITTPHLVKKGDSIANSRAATLGIG